MRTIPFVTTLTLATAIASVGQTQNLRMVRGTVLDSAGTPISGAIVSNVGDGARHAVTGPTGRFVTRAPADGRLVAASIGFAPETLAVADSLAFRLRAAPVLFDPIVVSADRAFTAASAAYLTQIDVALRPRESSLELLRLVPGLVIAQHAGGGKAEQVFLRGFDADHGTDVAVSVDGTPVNMVSHAHGQGYADLHWLMPEVVEGVDVRKGPYDAADGDFATAGAVSFRTLDRLGIDRPWFEARGGSFGTGHATALVPFGHEAGRAGGYLAGSWHRTDGPFEQAQAYGRYNLYGKVTVPVAGNAELVASASGFAASWSASGQVPGRAVAAGTINRFGAIDATEGGHTQRQEASLALRSLEHGSGSWEVRAFAARYRLKLYSNFTFYLRDTLNGDGIGQFDDRIIAGLRTTYSRPNTLYGRPGSWDVGAGARHDWNDLQLLTQRARTVLGTQVANRIGEGSAYGWLRQAVDLSSRLRVEAALRGDLFRFAVANARSGAGPLPPSRSGVRWRGVVSPKLNVAFQAAPGTTLFANAAGGFHSNDARDALLATAGERVLPRARGSEVGARHSWSGGSLSAAAWLLDLESELVYVGDEGTTEPSGRTRRVGVDVGGRVKLARWLWADADLSLSRGRLRDEPAGADLVPLAPTRVATLGLTVQGAEPVGGGVRVRHVGRRAANETNTVMARGYTLTELFGSWQIGRAEVRLTVDNLFGVEWNEAQFATLSRLPGEAPEGVEELHYTPGSPRAAGLAIAWRF